MHEDVLAVRSLKRADGRHQRAARAGAVARTLLVHMTRIEAERTVVALVAPAGERDDEALAVTAAEALTWLVSAPPQRMAGRRLIRRHARTARVGPPARGVPRALVLWLVFWLLVLVSLLARVGRTLSPPRMRLLALSALRLVASCAPLSFESHAGYFRYSRVPVDWSHSCR